MNDFADILGIEPARPSEIEKVYDFFATAPGGLDGFTEKELRSLKGVRDLRIDRRRRQSRVHFRFERSPRRLLDLRTVSAIFADLGKVEDVTVGRPGMLRVADALARMDIIPSVALFDVLNGPPRNPGVRVTCTVGRGHRFSAGELQQVLLTVLAAQYDLDAGEQSGPYTIHVSIERRRARVGLRLATPGVRDHTHALVGGELPSPVAAAVALIGQPRAGERWLDPVCRGGGSLIEAGLLQAITLTALDTHEACVRAAAINSAAAGLSLATSIWDGRHLPCRGEAVDCVVADLTRRDVFDLPDLMRVCQPALKPEGRLVVVTDRDREVEARAEAGNLPFRLARRYPIHLRGLHPSIYHFISV